MDVNDNAGCLNARVVLASIASKLAPTGADSLGEATTDTAVFRPRQGLNSRDKTK
jgi:hypothetical protein